MKTKVILIMLLVGVSPYAHADFANSGNSQFYYQIGGARSILAPLTVDASSDILGGSGVFGLGYSCGKFDVLAGVTNVLNDLENNLVTGITGAISGAISSLPMLILQRVNPGLYDLAQGFIIKAEGIIALSNKTCEQYESDIRQGKNPYAEWTNISKMIDWKVQMRTGSDVNAARKAVEIKNGKHGIPWLEGQRAGGEPFQDAIKPTEDIVKAGYNLSFNRNAKNSSNAPSDHRLSEIWGSPAKATNWAVDVLGDIHIQTFDDHRIKSRPGHGLAPKIELEKESIQEQLEKLVSGDLDPSIANTSKVSSDDLLINYDLIKAIQNLGPSERSIAISKLASEVAMSKTLEKALFVRRLLLTGMREPNVSQIPQAIAYAKDAIETINDEIENVLFEKRIRTELASKTANIILAMQEQSERRGKLDMQEPGYDRNLIKEGATVEIEE